MDQADRLFGEIAVRLQLLTREQVAECVQVQETGTRKELGSIAVEVGHITSAEAELIAAQQARILARRRDQRGDDQAPAHVRVEEVQATRSPRTLSQAPRQGALVEERAVHHDPRSASTPPPPPSRAAQDRAAGMRPGRTVNSRWAGATGGSAVAIVASQPPCAREAEPEAPATAAGEFDAFPMAEGDERLDVDAREVAARPTEGPRPGSAGSAKLGIAGHASAPAFTAQPFDPEGPAVTGNTIMMPSVAPPPRADQVPAPRTVTARPEPQSAPARATTARPAPRAVEQKALPERPAAFAADPRKTYLGKALALARRQGASDLHVHSGAPLMVRVDGALRPLSDGQVLTAEAAPRIIAEVMTDEQWDLLSERGEVDFAYDVPDVARCRVNVYHQQGGLDLVFRVIAHKPPTLTDLGLPARLARLTDYRTGMVLCTGPSGCGKSTTLAALLGVLVEKRADHILTIEDPVEYIFPPGRALVTQRQIGDHTTSFARALRAALREDPDIIAITELRDRETMSLAISAAETGHLVLGTLHTGNAAQTIGRIVNSFPADEQEQIRVMLSESLRAVLSQRLVPAATGRGRVPAIELLMVNTAVSNLIRDDKTFQLPSVMQTGKAAGMVTLDDSLADLVASGAVTREQARRFAVKKERFG